MKNKETINLLMPSGNKKVTSNYIKTLPVGGGGGGGGGGGVTPPPPF